MKIDEIYVWFERAVSAALMLGMAVVILLATFSFLRSTVDAALAFGGPLDFRSFQVLFDRVLVAIIALELAHSVQQMVAGQRGLTQVKTVIVIGMLAVVRKLILIEIETTSGLFLLGIAAAVLSLGIVFALVLWMDAKGSGGLGIRTPGTPADESGNGRDRKDG